MKGKPHLSGWNSNLRGWTSPQFSVQKKFKNLSSFKIYCILHLKNISCSVLVRKHALNALRPLNCHNCSDHMGEKRTLTTKRGNFNPKPWPFFHRRKAQTARKRLHAPGEMSNKHRQLLKRGGRCCVCLHKNQMTAPLTGVGSTPIWYCRARPGFVGQTLFSHSLSSLQNHVQIRHRRDYHEQKTLVVVNHHYQGCQLNTKRASTDNVRDTTIYRTTIHQTDSLSKNSLSNDSSSNCNV